VTVNDLKPPYRRYLHYLTDLVTNRNPVCDFLLVGSGWIRKNFVFRNIWFMATFKTITEKICWWEAPPGQRR